jgi:probable phosphoglycerate mutase
MSVFLARHGETDWNREGRMQGRLGATLNATGRAQAQALAGVARSLGVRSVIASPLPRALETAETVASALGCSVVRCDALMELDFGACSGLTEREIDERFPGLREQRLLDKWRHRWPGGESYADALERLERALREGVLPGAPLTLLVAHQSVNRALALALGGLAPAEALAMSQRSDVLLRFERGEMAHASYRGGGELAWLAGPYRGSAPKLN